MLRTNVVRCCEQSLSHPFHEERRKDGALGGWLPVRRLQRLIREMDELKPWMERDRSR